ncbi:hypothetical protein [Chelativorans sp. M5D2P16]|uniref:hypothetical protein n=1 Tax=Chelativorans sp. M5D2P16 TaxID=3095678 RepID=UPI002ACA8C28|nr:hypothetical protein [Chelativorans sp. M5D2P16]MDZ5697816.1 hypothetical protein [Chelativorans sp. M5D2P16]
MIERHEAKNQVCCDTCPACYPNTYADEDFAVMIADAKTAGWVIRKLKADPNRDPDTAELFGAEPRLARKDDECAQPYTHTCPDCAARQKVEGRLI